MPPEEPMLRGEAEAALDDLKASTAFLTRFPHDWLGPAAAARPDFRRAARVFPVVGLLVGIVGAAVLVIGAWLNIPPLVTATLAVLATMMFTGGLHEDGLADTADGFGGGATPTRKLEIMDDSRVGTFGVAAIVFSILLRVAALASLMALGAFRAGLVLLAAEALSRAAMVRIWQDLPAARLGGLSHDTGPPDHPAMVVALVLGVAVALVLAWIGAGLGSAILGILVAGVATYIFIRLSYREIGGRTGDTLGAGQQIAAVAFLIGAAAG